MHRQPLYRSLLGSLLLLVSLAGVAASAEDRFGKAWGKRYRAPAANAAAQRKQFGTSPMGRLRHWNEFAINAAGLDHTPVAVNESRVFGEQLGPTRSSRAMAIVHFAIFDAVNAIVGGYQSYTGLPREPGESSIQAAMAQAAHDTLSVLYPSQVPRFAAELAADLAKIPNSKAKSKGINLGHRAAAAILTMRAADGSDHEEPEVNVDFITSDLPGKWRQDPISKIRLALGAYWNQVTPFVLSSADQFRAPAPPALDSEAYANAYEDAKRLGGDGITTPTERTAEQTEIGTFWAYDGTPSLCAPPRLYNQITVHIAEQMHSNFIEMARLLALVNVAMADAGIAVWDAKYFYQFWRPITGIRESDVGSGPTGLGDGNAMTMGDVNFLPLGAPASNLSGPDFTPPFPAYPSGHAGFGGALFQVLRGFYRTDNIPFTFVSDEFNGLTKDSDGNVRPLKARTFNSLSEAEEENGQSRIYLGIHWSFDKTEGIAQGRRVANYVLKNVFQPARHH